MDNHHFRLFVDWCGSQAKAARRIGRCKATVCRLYNNAAPVSRPIAIAAEKESGGLFSAASLMELEGRVQGTRRTA